MCWAAPSPSAASQSRGELCSATAQVVIDELADIGPGEEVCQDSLLAEVRTGPHDEIMSKNSHEVNYDNYFFHQNIVFLALIMKYVNVFLPKRANATRINKSGPPTKNPAPRKIFHSIGRVM